MVTAQFMTVAALSMAFMVLLMNVVVWQYALGVVRAALDEGVRIGSPAQASAFDCQEAMDRVLDELVGGPLGREIVTACAFAGNQVITTASGSFSSWFPLVPDLAVNEQLIAVKESDD
jgi:hypothetical protein